MRRLAFVSLALFLLLSAARSSSHPHGLPSVDRTIDLVHVAGGVFRVAYTLDFSAAPAIAELDSLDANGDGTVTEEEQRAYLARRIPPLIAGWVVEINGARADASLEASHLDVIAPSAGLETLHIDCEVRVEGKAPEAGQAVTLHVRDDSFSDVPGSREIRMEGGARRATPPSPRDIDATFVLGGNSPRSTRLFMGVLLGAIGALLSVVLLRRERSHTCP